MAAIDISSVSAPLNTGVLQLQNGVAMDSTLRNVADQSNTTSPLKLSTSAVQVASTLQITTNSNPYIDAEDGAGNNRFQVGRDPSSQVVNIDFASNPTGGTNMVGGIRTYTDGVNLAQVMSFRKDGYIGAGTTSPTAKMHIVGENTSSSSYSVKVLSSVGQGIFSVTNDGYTQIGDFSAQGYGSFLAFLRPSGGTRVTTFNQGNSNLTITNTNGNVTYQNTPVTIIGSGSTSATTSLLVQNSSGTTSLQVTDDRTTFVNGLLNVGTIYSGIECTALYSSIFQNGGSGGQIRLSMGGTNYLQVNQPKDANSGIISGTINTITTPIGYGWSLGTASPNLLSLNPSINNTGSYSGTFRGIYYNPTLTSLTGTTHIAFENTTGDVLLNTTSGNTLIGSGASNTAKLSIKGSGSTSATTSLLVQNSIGNQLLKVDDEGSVTIGSSSYFYTSPLLTLISNVGSFTMRVGGGNQLQCSASISATNLASNDYVQCIRVLVGNGNVRLLGNTTDWLGIADSAQTSNASGNLSAKFGTFGTTYASIDSSAQVEIASTTKGFLPPRMTNAQRAAITTPAIGLMVYCTDAVEGIYVYKSTGWTFVA